MRICYVLYQFIDKSNIFQFWTHGCTKQDMKMSSWTLENGCGQLLLFFGQFQQLIVEINKIQAPIRKWSWQSTLSNTMDQSPEITLRMPKCCKIWESHFSTNKKTTLDFARHLSNENCSLSTADMSSYLGCDGRRAPAAGRWIFPAPQLGNLPGNAG